MYATRPRAGIAHEPLTVDWFDFWKNYDEFDIRWGCLSYFVLEATVKILLLASVEFSHYIMCGIVCPMW